MKRIITRLASLSRAIAIIATVGTFFLSSITKVSGQQDKGWKVWVRTSPCSGGRTDWVTVAKENPATGGGGSSWMLADQSLCTRDDSCSFSLANVVAGNIRKSNKFFDYCCHDYSVWENTSTREMSAVRGSGSAGFGWRFVKGELCCEQAEAMTGKTGMCGGTIDGSSCFASDPGMGSTSVNDHYNWAQGKSASQLEANLKSKIDLLYRCSSVSDDSFANAFADLSALIGRRVPNAACFNGDRGAISPDRNGHYQWARTKTRRQLFENLQWKMTSALRCLDADEQKSFFADVSVPIARLSPAVNTGGNTGSGTSSKGCIGFAGKWLTSIENVVLILNAGGSGSYFWRNQNNTINGSVSGNVLEGQYQQAWHTNDNLKSGRVKFTLSADGNSFTGQWWYRDGTLGGSWNGTCQSGN